LLAESIETETRKSKAAFLAQNYQAESVRAGIELNFEYRSVGIQNGQVCVLKMARRTPHNQEPRLDVGERYLLHVGDDPSEKQTEAD
jgi:hypothetical protein